MRAVELESPAKFNEPRRAKRSMNLKKKKTFYAHRFLFNSFALNTFYSRDNIQPSTRSQSQSNLHLVYISSHLHHHLHRAVITLPSLESLILLLTGCAASNIVD